MLIHEATRYLVIIVYMYSIICVQCIKCMLVYKVHVYKQIVCVYIKCMCKNQ